MNGKLIMEFMITFEAGTFTSMKSSNGSVVFIPFGGSVESELFTGTIRPGAADVQVCNPAGVRHMHARYIFEGVDSKGEKCHLFVDNNGWFERDHMPAPFEATPTFMTDSPTLAPYLHGAHFRAEGHGREGGITIKIFDIDQ